MSEIIDLFKSRSRKNQTEHDVANMDEDGPFASSKQVDSFLSDLCLLVRSHTEFMDKKEAASILCLLASELVESMNRDMPNGIEKSDIQRALKRSLAGIILDSNYTR